MIAEREPKFDATSRCYCTVVSAVIFGLIGSAAILTPHPSIAVVVPALSVILAALFPIGLVMQALHRRLFTPWPVLGCIAVTGLWCASLVRMNLMQ